MALRCVIVDDSPALLDAASALLAREGIAVVGLASTIYDALELVEELQPDVTLVDIDLGGDSGFDLVRQLRGRSILTSTHAEGDFAELIAASPALGFLSKSNLSARAIEGILNGTPET